MVLTTLVLVVLEQLTKVSLVVLVDRLQPHTQVVVEEREQSVEMLVLALVALVALEWHQQSQAVQFFVEEAEAAEMMQVLLEVLVEMAGVE